MIDMTTTSTNGDIEAFLNDFERGWRRPDPHAWDHLLADDVVLHQPLMPPITGREAFADEYARLLALIPDLTGRVINWALGKDRLYIEMELRGTLGGKALTLHLLDRLTLDANGRISQRRAYFDPLPAIHTLLTAPRGWRRWWRSGIGPLAGRRRLLRRRNAT